MEILSELDDQALLRQIQHGNEAALEEFYHRFAPGLYAFIHHRVANSQDIEDILSETMAAAVKSIMRFQGKSKIYTWLCRIAEYKLVDFYRRRGNVTVLPLDEVVAGSTFQEKDVEMNIIICQTLLKINQKYRQVLEAKYFFGFSTREIAVRMRLSEKSVESILVRARQAFAREYQRLVPE